jgi:putative oxidoreductase
MSSYAAVVKPSLIARAIEAVKAAHHGLDFLAPIADLLVRLWVADVFWKSGLTKLQSWDTTLLLFNEEYRVPLLPPEVAAYAGAFTELFFPVLLAVGLGGRLAAFVLFVFNIIAVVSYPDLNPAGLHDHQLWGLLLLVILLHGPDKLSVDHLIARLMAKKVRWDGRSRPSSV